MINQRVEEILHLLDKVRSYDRLITSDSFKADTISDMKDNAKDICDQAKDEIDLIKDEIDEWG